MKNKYVFITIILVLVLLFLKTNTLKCQPQWNWAQGEGSKDIDWENALVTDASGNVYLAGAFRSNSFLKYVMYSKINN